MKLNPFLLAFMLVNLFILCNGNEEFTFIEGIEKIRSLQEAPKEKKKFVWLISEDPFVHPDYKKASNKSSINFQQRTPEPGKNVSLARANATKETQADDIHTNLTNSENSTKLEDSSMNISNSDSTQNKVVNSSFLPTKEIPNGFNETKSFPGNLSTENVITNNSAEKNYSIKPEGQNKSLNEANLVPQNETIGLLNTSTILYTKENQTSQIVENVNLTNVHRIEGVVGSSFVNPILVITSMTKNDTNKEVHEMKQKADETEHQINKTAINSPNNSTIHLIKIRSEKIIPTHFFSFASNNNNSNKKPNTAELKDKHLKANLNKPKIWFSSKGTIPAEQNSKEETHETSSVQRTPDKNNDPTEKNDSLVASSCCDKNEKVFEYNFVENIPPKSEGRSINKKPVQTVTSKSNGKIALKESTSMQNIPAPLLDNFSEKHKVIANSKSNDGNATALAISKVSSSSIANAEGYNAHSISHSYGSSKGDKLAISHAIAGKGGKSTVEAGTDDVEVLNNDQSSDEDANSLKKDTDEEFNKVHNLLKNS